MIGMPDMERFDQLPDDVLSEITSEWLTIAQATHGVMLEHLRGTIKSTSPGTQRVTIQEAPHCTAILNWERDGEVGADVQTLVGQLILPEVLRKQPDVFYFDRAVALLVRHYDTDTGIDELASGLRPQLQQGQDINVGAERVSMVRRNLRSDEYWRIRSGTPSLVLAPTENRTHGMYLHTGHLFLMPISTGFDIID